MARRLTSLACCLAAVLWFVCLPARAADSTGNDFFEKKIRPVLIEHCYQCHSASSKEVKGGLKLDTREATLKGGESGRSIIPGKPEESLLIQALKHDGLEMPPKTKLADGIIADFEEWIRMGAPDPRRGNTVGKKISVVEARKHWAFQPPKITPPPALKNPAWAKNEVDKYILAKLEEKQLTPAVDADKPTLLKRLHYDLIGLPPTPEEIDEFVMDNSPSAVQTVVDKLLASPHFGERWGRHWLDVARYGESTGKERNIVYPYAWRYRDYVIDSFNEDKPYDKFIREQISGDLLPAKSAAERNELTIATGFLAIGPKGLNERNPEQFAMDVVDEQIDVSTRAIMGVSVACARCHDHKFDPFPQADYYAMAGIFRSTEVLSGVKRGNNKTGYDGQYAQLASADSGPAPLADRQKLMQLERDLAQAKAALRRAADDPAPAKGKGKKTAKGKKKGKGVSPEERQVAQIQRQIDVLKSPKDDAAEPCMAVRDANKVTDCRILNRGEVNEPGESIPRGYVRILTTFKSPDVNPNQSGRLQLAQWFTEKQNPLTARVMVNRVWYHLFGTGLVETIDNFGALSEQPSHPELLDYMAVKFMEHGWSVKKMIRGIVLSRTYQLSSQHLPANYEIDPDNRLVWRMSRRRLSAESIRDGMLAISGALETERPYASPALELGRGEVGRRLNLAPLRKQSQSRSVYLPLVRGVVPEMLSVFDVADPELPTAQRDVTTVATQALFLMNADFVREQARGVSARLLEEDNSESDQIEQAYLLILNRPPTPSEKSLATNYLTEFRERQTDKAKTARESQTDGLTGLAHALFSTAEFRYTY
jgi:hypothetical protein